MSAPNANETGLMVLLGELKGSVDALLRSQQELNSRLSTYESATEMRFKEIDNRVGSLERIRWKVAGFTVGVAALLAAFKHKLVELAAAVSTVFGG